MPELPEVEVVRRGLAEHLVGAVIAAVRVDDARVLRRHRIAAEPMPPGELARQLMGMRVTAVERRGKFLWLPLVTAHAARLAAAGSVGVANAACSALTAHLGMTGQMLVHVVHTPAAFVPPPLPPHLRAELLFRRSADVSEALSFVDQRLFGWIAAERLVNDGRGRLVPRDVVSSAPDPMEPAFDEDAVVARMRRSRATVKALLLDQRLVSGIGNIYADEALWRARVRWSRPGRSVSGRRLHALVAAVREVFADALAQGGTSFDRTYVNVDGEPGYFTRSLAVYGRPGLPCPRCGATIRRARFANRSAFFCPLCER